MNTLNLWINPPLVTKKGRIRILYIIKRGGVTNVAIYSSFYNLLKILLSVVKNLIIVVECLGMLGGGV